MRGDNRPPPSALLQDVGTQHVRASPPVARREAPSTKRAPSPRPMRGASEAHEATGNGTSTSRGSHRRQPHLGRIQSPKKGACFAGLCDVSGNGTNWKRQRPLSSTAYIATTGR